MAEFSLFWTTGGAGDGTSTYTMVQLIDWLRRTFHSGANQGVLKGYANGLAVSGVATPVSIATGAAYVYGYPYENGAVVTVAIPTPGGATRIDRIVLRAGWAAQTVRITRIAGVEGGGAPAMTQTPATTYDIPLAQVSITTGGVITVTDEREYLHPNFMVLAAKISDGWTGWVDRTEETWTYVSATSFTVLGDQTAKYRKGAKLRWKEGGGYKYGYVVSSSYGAPVTTVTLTGGSDYALAGGAITDTHLSCVENPDGFPDWFNWTPAIVGYSADPTDVIYRFCIKGRTVFLQMVEVTNGTSDATGHTYTLPVAAAATANHNQSAVNAASVNNGATVNPTLASIFASAPTLLQVFKDTAGAAWTASGASIFAAKGFQMTYEMA
jgi:hypothetical protein